MKRKSCFVCGVKKFLYGKAIKHSEIGISQNLNIKTRYDTLTFSKNVLPSKILELNATKSQLIYDGSFLKAKRSRLFDKNISL